MAVEITLNGETRRLDAPLSVRGLLESAGIDALISALDNPQDVFPVGGVIIRVPASQAEEARRLIEQGGFSVNGVVAGDPTAAAGSFAPLADGSLLVRKGRRDYRRLERA